MGIVKNCSLFELLTILRLACLLFHFRLWCPQGRAASSLAIALLSLPLLLTSQCLTPFVTGTSRGAQSKDWDGHFFVSACRDWLASINW